MKVRLLLVLADFINPKTGRKIFACDSFFDHAAKTNQSSYPWSRNVVSLGLLKWFKGRWTCLPLAFRFYYGKDICRVRIDSIDRPLANANRLRCKMPK